MRAARNARPSAGRSNDDLVRTPGLPVKHGHAWHTTQAGRKRAINTHEARVAAQAAAAGRTVRAINYLV